jgi:hypothetical protein
MYEKAPLGDVEEYTLYPATSLSMFSFHASSMKPSPVEVRRPVGGAGGVLSGPMKLRVHPERVATRTTTTNENLVIDISCDTV